MGDDTSAAAAAGAGAEDGDGEGEEEGGDGDEAASIAGAGAGTTPRLTLLWTQPMIEKAAGLGARNHVYATAKGARALRCRPVCEDHGTLIPWGGYPQHDGAVVEAAQHSCAPFASGAGLAQWRDGNAVAALLER